MDKDRSIFLVFGVAEPRIASTAADGADNVCVEGWHFGQVDEVE